MMKTNLFTITIPPMIKGLQNLSAILDKAYTHADSKKLSWKDADAQMETLLQARLIFDQFPLIKQIQITCDNAKGAVARLAAIEVPKFEDNEKTLTEVKQRIEKTIQILEEVKPEQIAEKEEVQVTLPYYKDQYFTGFEYVHEYLIPNFYFHLTTAYSILRMNGVDVGKADFLGTLPLKKM